MPLYEYRCAICGRRFEVLQRMGQDAAGLRCPGCGRSAIVKEYSTFAGTTGNRGDSAGAGCSPSGRFT